MSLHLDTRQRAMLQEMGVHVWSPRPAPVAVATPAGAARPPPHRTPHTPQAAPPARPMAPVAAAPATTAPDTPAAPLTWVLQTPQPVYPNADTQTAPTEASPCWLLVAEGVAGADPLAGDAGRLLDNMLRAVRLHQQPQVFLCVLTPLAADVTGATDATSGGAGAAPYVQALTQAIASVQPAVLLLMGRATARAVLGRSEPLGQLRAQTHAVAGVPAVVTYDTSYLLRAPGAKAGAWDDLCRARVLARGDQDSAAPAST